MPGSGGEEVMLRVFGALAAEPLLVTSAHLETTVGDIKAALERAHGVPPREQRLLVGSHRLCAPEARGGGEDDGRRLREALGEAWPTLGAGLDVTLLRVAPAWAEVRELLQEGELGLDAVDEAHRSDRELVLAAVSRDGRELGHAAAALRADRQLALSAVRRDGLALEFVAPVLRDDREVVLSAVRSCSQALQHASDALRADPEVVRAAMSMSWRSLQHAHEDLRSDRAFVLAAVQEQGSALCFASPGLQADREVVLAAVRSSGWALSCASEELRRDRECVFTAVSKNPAALDFAATEELRSDPDLQSVVARAGGRGVSAAPCGLDATPHCSLL